MKTITEFSKSINLRELQSALENAVVVDNGDILDFDAYTLQYDCLTKELTLQGIYKLDNPPNTIMDIKSNDENDVVEIKLDFKVIVKEE